MHAVCRALPTGTQSIADGDWKKVTAFGHMCRMSNPMTGNLLFGKMMDSKNKIERPHTEWTDDIAKWCGANLQELSHLATCVLQQFETTEPKSAWPQVTRCLIDRGPGLH